MIPVGESHQTPLHQHPATIELVLMLEGAVQCDINDERHTASSATVLVIPSESWHEQVYAASQQQCGYQLTVCLNSDLLPSFIAKWPPVIPIRDIKRLKSLFVHLQHEKEWPQTDSHQIKQQLLGLLFTFINRSTITQNTRNELSLEDLIGKIKNHIEENHSKSLSLEQLANQFQLTKYELARLFKQVTGISPLQYIIWCRIMTAKRLLQTTQLSIALVAKKVGYKSATQFQAAFKKTTGVTPRSYRIHSISSSNIKKS
ncbi:helix-turn-helix transcriptional regulator [Planococcus versutus]|uniref:helix-turn-helix transcriptional regulator n=1 Tax=Planococcus versutus TaxID=1302659 RepID=UPI001EF6F3AF|nr:helix-turn-helix domain-containing protein [Planococcus versutus]